MLAYTIQGKGKPLIFLHGYLENKELWQDFLKYFSNYTCICLDLPNCGQNSITPMPSIEAMADEVFSTLQKINITKASFIAHSMGGYVSLALANKYSNMLDRLILLHSHPFADSDEKRKARLQEIEIIKAGKKLLLLQQFIPKLYAPHFHDKHCFALSQKMAENTSTEGMIACLQAMANRSDNSSLLHQTTFPVLWIYGRYDQLFNFELAENFKTNNPVVTKHLLNQSGHMGMFEQPLETANIINSFLK
ncbi:MAG: alpha/beta hydrolase [Bacteroidales bacterium]|nr:alpha/beta hydrolase [Bacteroidales bacterium]